MDFFWDEITDHEQRVGRSIYMSALYGRRGFRDDQLGIPSDDEVWADIFAHIGRAAIFAVKDISK